MTDPEPSAPMLDAEATLPPLPWDWVASGAPDATGRFHAYLVDATGRKIAAIWGRGAEKELIADHILKLVNSAGNAQRGRLPTILAPHRGTAMTDTEELIERLNYFSGLAGMTRHQGPLLKEAADALAAQAQEIKRLTNECETKFAELCGEGERADAAEARVREMEAKTIERCAQIAETNYVDGGWHPHMSNAGSTIAAIIRALRHDSNDANRSSALGGL